MVKRLYFDRNPNFQVAKEKLWQDHCSLPTLFALHILDNQSLDGYEEMLAIHALMHISTKLFDETQLLSFVEAIHHFSHNSIRQQAWDSVIRDH